MAENVLGTIFGRADALKRQLYDMIRNPSDYASMVGGRTQENLATAQALQNQAFGDPQNPLRITNPQALNQLTQMITSGPLGFAPAGITAFHGSPYLFRQFDPMKVGTGEGAQAYGVGSGYTAEARPVAEDYARRIIKREDPENYAIKNVANRLYKGGFDDEYVKNRLKTVFPEIKDEQINASIKFAKSPEAAGYLYKGDIPDEILPKFLDWDKKFSEQTPEVKEAVKKYWNENKVYGDPSKLSGAGIYDSIVAHVYSDSGRAGAQQTASSELEKIGVRGIRYLDEGSRGSYKAQLTYKDKPYSDVIDFKTKEQLNDYIKESEEKGFGVKTFPQTSNFVPFRPEDFKIQEINDIPIEDYIAKGLL